MRGLAVILVILHHWTSWGHAANLGNIGVQLFFVLSGFLITNILLDQSARMATGAASFWPALRVFFVRRAFRIWPVLFLTLGLVFLAGDRFEQRAAMPWHALLASNILFFMRGEFSSTLAHFWSFAVEQQFYFIWPLVIFLAPRRWLEAIILVLIVVAPISRLTLVVAGYSQFAEYNVLPFANLDLLGLGALVALWLRLPVGQMRPRLKLLKWIAVASIAALVIVVPGSIPGNVAQTLFATIFAAAIVAAFRGLGGNWASFLRPLAWSRSELSAMASMSTTYLHRAQSALCCVP